MTKCGMIFGILLVAIYSLEVSAKTLFKKKEGRNNDERKKEGGIECQPSPRP